VRCELRIQANGYAISSRISVVTGISHHLGSRAVSAGRQQCLWSAQRRDLRDSVLGGGGGGGGWRVEVGGNRNITLRTTRKSTKKSSWFSMCGAPAYASAALGREETGVAFTDWGQVEVEGGFGSRLQRGDDVDVEVNDDDKEEEEEEEEEEPLAAAFFEQPLCGGVYCNLPLHFMIF
jgi:hypothetical protein